MQEFPCIETTIDIQVDNFDVRLWVNETAVEYQEREGIETLVRKVNDVYVITGGEGCLQQDFARGLAKNIPHINAVQVRTNTNIFHFTNVKVGTMIYTVPFNDYITT